MGGILMPGAPVRAVLLALTWAMHPWVLAHLSSAMTKAAPPVALFDGWGFRADAITRQRGRGALPFAARLPALVPAHGWRNDESLTAKS